MNKDDLQIRDPFIFEDNGFFYLTGTHYGEYNNAVFIYSSNDLTNFVEAMHFEINGDYERHSSWAPEIHKFNDLFYIFVTLKKINGKRGTFVYVSDKLLGDYRLVSENPITPKDWMCLDATLFVDQDGTPYTIFCREWLEVRNGEMYIAKLSNDLSHIVGEPKLLFTAKDPKWSFPIYSDGFVTDGPFVWYERGKYHMIWSSFCKRDPKLQKNKNDEPKEYALSHITSEKLFGPWIQEDYPLISGDAGHGMVFEKDGEKNIAMHYPNEPSGTERLRIVKLGTMENKRAEKKKIIFDTDIGDDIDDAFALLMLLGNKDVDLIGVTTVFRNSVDRAKMARKIIEMKNRDIPCFAGIDNPLVQDIDTLNPDYIRAKEKLNEFGKYVLPQWKNDMKNCPISKQSAIDFIIDSVNKYPGEITILATGPFTNIATVIQKDPSIVNKIKEIRIMGGRVYPSDPVEWNIKCDPEAAKIMYNSRANLGCVGINVTETCVLSEEFIEELKSKERNDIKLISDLMELWFEHYNRHNPTMHDPIAACSLFEDFIEWEEQFVDVSLEGDSRGVTYIAKDGPRKIKIAVNIDKDKFFEVFKRYLNAKN